MSTTRKCSEPGRTEVVKRIDSEAPHTVGFGDLRTVRQLASMNPAFSESSLRWLLFNAEKNGLECAVFKVGSRVLIDVLGFERWLEEKRVAQPGPTKVRGDHHV